MEVIDTGALCMLEGKCVTVVVYRTHLKYIYNRDFILNNKGVKYFFLTSLPTIVS